MPQPLLSIGMIAKNEERCLEKCLKALEPLRQVIPCELVIADTGSTDKTKEIAKKYADTLFDFTWVNDFSKARNAVMDKCSGKWFLTVDADEYLIPDTNEIVSFLNSPSEQKKIFATVVIRNYGDIEMKGTYSDFNALRLVRMNTGIRYEGAIHESLTVTNIEQIHVLTDTVFDHDGYAAVSPEHLIEKEKRNLKLLEEKLSKNPDNLQCILQCLESSAYTPEKKSYYINLAFQKLSEYKGNDISFKEFAGPPCIRTIVKYAIADNDYRVDDFVKFAFDKFPDSDHTLIDVNYLYAEYLSQNKKYADAIKHCKAYLENLDKYISDKNNFSAVAFTTPVYSIHKNHKEQMLSILLNCLIETNCSDDALQYVDKIDLLTASNSAINNWILAIANKNSSEKIQKKACSLIGNLFENYANQETASSTQYNTVLNLLSSIFSCNEQSNFDFNKFADIPGTISLSVKIANATTREETESYLQKIENWDEFMPVALKNALKLNATLPDEFYHINYSRMNYLTTNLTFAANDICDSLVNELTVSSEKTNLHKIAFYFNLIVTLLLNKDIIINNEKKATYLNVFYKVADIFLNACYNKNILENEDYVSCLQETHILAWYLVKANKLRDKNPLEYVKALRSALQKVPQAKEIVEFLIEELRAQEEKKKQEQIKNASPELIAMANQLKTMLSAFPPDSPQLLAIKQSPMYKQVAFLIEE